MNRVDADWSAMRLAYLGGETFKSIAQIYNIRESTLRSRSSREKWHLPPTRILAAPEEAAVSLQRAHDLWAQRKDRVKESEFSISERIMRHAETMPEEQLINKADKIKIGVDMGRRSVGLDTEEKKQANAVNIAILGDVDPRSLAAMGYDPLPNFAEGEQAGLTKDREVPRKTDCLPEADRATQ